MSGRYDAHRCPNRCHRCPDLVKIAEDTDQDVKDEVVTTMPGCMGGVMYGLSGCHCWDRRAEREDYRIMRERRRSSIGQLARLISAFPEEARRILAGDLLDDIVGKRRVRPRKPTRAPSSSNKGTET